jgi:hypothetical protein
MPKSSKFAVRPRRFRSGALGSRTPRIGQATFSILFSELLEDIAEVWGNESRVGFIIDEELRILGKAVIEPTFKQFAPVGDHSMDPFSRGVHLVDTIQARKSARKHGLELRMGHWGFWTIPPGRRALPKRRGDPYVFYGYGRGPIFASRIKAYRGSNWANKAYSKSRPGIVESLNVMERRIFAFEDAELTAGVSRRRYEREFQPGRYKEFQKFRSQARRKGAQIRGWKKASGWDAKSKVYKRQLKYGDGHKILAKKYDAKKRAIAKAEAEERKIIERAQRKADKRMASYKKSLAEVRKLRNEETKRKLTPTSKERMVERYREDMFATNAALANLRKHGYKKGNIRLAQLEAKKRYLDDKLRALTGESHREFVLRMREEAKKRFAEDRSKRDYGTGKPVWKQVEGLRRSRKGRLKKAQRNIK